MQPNSAMTGNFWFYKCMLLYIISVLTTIAHADMKLTFGVYTADQPTEMVKAYRPILTGMESELSARFETKVNISLKVASTYEKGVSDLVHGNVDFSMLGPASYIVARKQNPSLRILAIESKNDSKTFNGVIGVSTDSPIQSVEQLAGKSFAFGNKSSTIGRYLAQAYLSDHEIVADDLSHYEYLGRHDRVGHAVGSGNYDAGALKEGTFNKLVKKGVKLRSIAKFPNVNKPWVASGHLDDSVYKELQSVMLGLKDQSLFKPFSRKRFVPGRDGDYDVIRNAIENNKKFFANSKSNVTVELCDEY